MIFFATLALIAVVTGGLLVLARHVSEKVAVSADRLPRFVLPYVREPTTFVRNALWILFVGVLAYSVFFSTVFGDALQYEIHKPIIEAARECGLKNSTLTVTYTKNEMDARCITSIGWEWDVKPTLQIQTFK